ncbi:MAG: rod shape-determining protein MreD [Eubacteriaceae bacterium]
MKSCLLFLILLLELFLSGSFFKIFTFFGGSPNLVLITLVIYGMFYKKRDVIIMAMGIGFLTDLIFSLDLGVSTVSYLVIVYSITMLKNKFNYNGIFTAFLFLFVSIMVYHGIIYLFFILGGWEVPIQVYLRQINLQYIIINLLFMVIIRFIYIKFIRNEDYEREELF